MPCGARGGTPPLAVSLPREPSASPARRRQLVHARLGSSEERRADAGTASPSATSRAMVARGAKSFVCKANAAPARYPANSGSRHCFRRGARGLDPGRGAGGSRVRRSPSDGRRLRRQKYRRSHRIRGDAIGTGDTAAAAAAHAALFRRSTADGIAAADAARRNGSAGASNGRQRKPPPMVDSIARLARGVRQVQRDACRARFVLRPARHEVRTAESIERKWRSSG